MNSNRTAHYSGMTPSECQFDFLGLRTTQTAIERGYAVQMFIAVLSSIASPLTTVVNLLVIISVKRKPQLKIISNTVLGCLAVTDALMGVIGMPLFTSSIIVTLQAETIVRTKAMTTTMTNMG